MGLRHWYEEAVLPRFIKRACGDPKVMALRAQLLPLAEGAVFELGVGGGLNQQFYDRARVARFAGIDPGAKLLDYAREAASSKGWSADLRLGRGEALPFPDASFDTVVSTYTLCSVEDQHRALSELRRVLKPSGKFLFLEHGHAPDSGPAKWQRRLEPTWRRIMGNCHLTRPVGKAIREAGFSVKPLGEQYMPGMPKWAGWMEWGVGRRA